MTDDAHPDRTTLDRDGTRTGTDADPRLDSEYVRRSTDDGAGDVLLVGVVHDHPSSKYRVQELVAREAPDVLALELPPLAIPLFEQYAEDERTPPALGGEMSTAVQAAETGRVEAIDGPAPRFLRRLVATLRREDASRSTVRTTARRFASITKHAAVCRLAACLGVHTSLRVEVDSPVDHECRRTDAPERQAADERRHVRRATSVMSALQTAPASRCCDEAREAHMAARLADLREEGDVLAVVGIGHLDAVSERLASE